MSSAAAIRMLDYRRRAVVRVRRHRERRKAGRAAVTIVVDEVATVEVLCAAKLLDPLKDHSAADIGHAIERLIELLGR